MRLTSGIAINSRNSLSANQYKNENSIRKLSSGLRIISASDDAAGLCISEEMRSQIRGLDQGARNIQDGRSLVQTADGGLNEIHELLQRGRELAVQANNDTLTSEDRAKIQEEITEINKGIDYIANNTEFNTRKLLGSSSISAANQTAADNVIAGLKKGWLEEAENRILDAYGLQGIGTSNLNIILDEGTPYGELAHVGGAVGNLELHIDIADFNPATGDSGDTVEGPGFYADRIIAHELTHAVMDDALGVVKMNDFHSNNAVWFVEGTAEFIPGADERLKQVIGNLTGTAIDNTRLDNLINRALALLNGATWSGNDQDYSAGYIIVKYIDEHLDGGDFSDLMNIIKTDGGSATTALKNGIVTLSSSFSSYSDFVSQFGNLAIGGARDYIQNSLDLDWSGAETDTGSIKGSDHGGGSLSAEAVIDESSSVSKDQPLIGFNVVWNASDSAPLILQIGANEVDTLKINLVNATSTALGVDGVNVIGSPEEGIQKFDSAIELVSKHRGYFGAINNRLEHISGIVNNASENLQASESKIRDVDLAKEMIDYKQSGILSQIATAMISFATKNIQSMANGLINQTGSNSSEDGKFIESKSVNQMSKTNNETNKVVEKISSGLRINKASDDAAGLSIREKMRGQILGLRQAERNVQDGISLVQTAEGGIAEIQSMVQRQRELCVQAASDTLNDSDRSSIQLEINQLNEEINSIANNTHFNNIHLLNVDDSGETNTVIGSGTPLSLNVDANGRLGFRTLDGYSNATADDNQILIFGNGSTSRPKVMVDGVERSLYDYTTTSTVLNGDTYETVYTVDGISIKQSVKVVGIDNNMYEVKYDITNTSLSNKNVGFLFNIDTMLGSDDFAPFRINDIPITNEAAYTGGAIPSEFVVYNHTTNQYLESRGVITGSFDGINIIEAPDKFAIGRYNAVDDWNFAPSGALGDSGYSLWWNPITMSSGDTRLVNTFYGLKKPDFTTVTIFDGLKIQTGANEGQFITICRKKITTDVLTTNGINVTTSASAQNSIELADKALNILSSERAKYGSYQNRLEKTSNFVYGSGENLTAAESRISDVDIAKESMKLAKNNILNQVVLSMMSQANSYSSDVLSLLK